MVGAGPGPVRPLGSAQREEALRLCARDAVANVYVAARILETDLDRSRGALLGFYPPQTDRLSALCWRSANVVPAECDLDASDAFASALRDHESRCSSIFGPTQPVAELWRVLSTTWHHPLDVRPVQPLMAMPVDRPLGIRLDPRVRLATVSETDLLTPAAAAMFTEEIGYAPYADRVGQSAYRNSVRALIARGHAFVLVEDDRVIFKADVGSAAIGACQIQGVWVAPECRGTGLAAPAMAATVELVRSTIAPLVTLYVNEYNEAALATYRRVGFEQVGTFSTILM